MVKRPIKNREGQSGLKTQPIYAGCKKLISNIMMQVGWNKKDGNVASEHM